MQIRLNIIVCHTWVAGGAEVAGCGGLAGAAAGPERKYKITLYIALPYLCDFCTFTA